MTSSLLPAPVVKLAWSNLAAHLERWRLLDYWFRRLREVFRRPENCSVVPIVAALGAWIFLARECEACKLYRKP